MGMRKIVRILVVVCAFVCFLATSARADAVSVVVDGHTVAFSQPPLVVNGRVLVPMRAVFEQLGATVTYQPLTRHIHAVRNGTVVDLDLGSSVAWINQRSVALDVPAQDVNDATMVPLRFVSEALGAQVSWNAQSDTVFISSQGPPVVTAPPLVTAPPVAVMPPVEPPTIRHMSISPTHLYSGQTLTVRMEGTSGGLASFDLPGVQLAIPMREFRPEHYEGSVVISSPLQTEDVPVTAHLTENGLTADSDSRTLHLVASEGPPAVAATAEPTNLPVGGDFVVIGNTMPYSRVRVYASLHRPALPSTTLTCFGRADAYGHFAIPINIGPQPVGTTAGLDVTAFDRVGNASHPVDFTIGAAP